MLLTVVGFVSPSPAQTLARPGLAGSGLKNSPWWQHAVFYQVDRSPGSLDFKAISARLDALRSLGVDALLLPAPELPVPGTNAPMPSFDDLDNLLRQASAHRIRVLLTIHASSPTADLSGVARFWLTRGVAGLHIAAAPGTSPDDAQAAVQKLRKLASSFAGQRIVLNDLDVDETANDAQTKRRTSRTANASTMQLQIDNRADRLSTLDAASLRPLLAQSIADPNLLLDLHAPASPNQRSPLAEATAAIALLTRPAALIDANLVLQPTLGPQPEAPEESAKPAPPSPPAAPPGTFLPYVPYVPPPKSKVATAPKPEPIDPLTSWYQQLAALRGSNIALRSGSKTLLDFDAQNTLVWVFRPASPSGRTPPVFVAINLSSSPVQLSLTEAIKKLNLHGFFLRTLLRSDQVMGAQDINAVNLPPFGVYIGELRL